MAEEGLVGRYQRRGASVGSSAIGLLFKRRQWAAHSGRAVTVVVGLLAHDHAEVVMAARAGSGIYRAMMAAGISQRPRASQIESVRFNQRIKQFNLGRWCALIRAL